MSKNPWIKRKKDKDDGWEYLEHGFKIKHTDRGRPMIFRQGQDPYDKRPHNKNWHTTPGGTWYFEPRQDRSKDWQIKGLFDTCFGCRRVGYSVPEGGIDE
jgi:hypothetical protein